MSCPLHRVRGGRLSLLTVLLSTLGICGTSFSWGQEAANSGSAQDQVSLRVGDAAPPLQVDHWLGGDAVESFSRDKVYVVEFWATWCGPCIKSMPHLNELAERYADEGLVVIAITKADEANTLDAVKEFVAGPGQPYRFRYAVCDGDATYQAYMQAAGQRGIPCSVVIDREGKVAYYGLPHDLDYVLDRVIKGQWRGAEDYAELRAMGESIGQLAQLAQSDPAKALQIAEHIRRVNPSRANGIDFLYAETLTLCKNGLHDRAKANVEALSDPGNKTRDWAAVALVSSFLASKELNTEGKHLDFALNKIQEAETALQDDWQNLLQVGMAYQMAGQTEKFKACMDRVVSLCPDEGTKKSLRMIMEMQSRAAQDR